MDRNINKIALCDENQCTGCEACKNSCPQSCISMQSDENGFSHPFIDYTNCTGCKICENSCPVLHKPIFCRSSEPSVYACWHKDDVIRIGSSSGGLFSAVAEVVLKKDGVVFGATYDENMSVYHTGVELTEDLKKLRKSKYVQSQIGNSYQKVKQFLESDKEVLFVGTPCQVIGLYSYLGREYESLLTADLICGGVPSPKVFAGYIESIESRFNTRLKDINFRDKRHGWENNSVIAMSTSRQYHLKGDNNSYFAGYILHLTLRESCYQCKFVGLPRVGDLTIADFWGVQGDNSISQREIDKGISLLMINNLSIEKELLSSLNKKLVLWERSLYLAKAGNSPMINNLNRPDIRDDFFRIFNQSGYKIAAQKYIKYPLKKKIIQFMKDNFNSKWLYALRRLKKDAGL